MGKYRHLSYKETTAQVPGSSFNLPSAVAFAFKLGQTAALNIHIPKISKTHKLQKTEDIGRVF